MIAPRCSLSGYAVDNGRLSVCLLNDHPRCRIPRLTAFAPAVPTEKGWLRPERALAHNQPELLLHHASSVRPGVWISAAALAGYEKTASRLLRLLLPFAWTRLQPLDWPEPELVLFTAGNDSLLYDLVLLNDALVQAEQLTLHSTGGRSFLGFRRC